MPLPYRTEGPLKVTGAKTFASDLRPADLGWPDACVQVLLLRSAFYDRAFKGLKLSEIPTEASPTRVLLADGLMPGLRLTIGEPDNKEVLFAQPGQLPDYLGQPVGFAFYTDYERYFAGTLELRENFVAHEYDPPVRRLADATLAQDVARWQRMSPPDRFYAQYHYVRVLNEDGSLEFGHARDGQAKPFDLESQSKNDVKARTHYFNIRRMIAEAGAAADRGALEHTTFTQCLDPMFLEPEAGLAWFDGKKLTLVLGTQSPAKDREVLLAMLVDVRPDIEVVVVATDCGGGFGGRDVSLFTQYLALAALHCDVPVRLAFDRYEQFQSGIKRHASGIHSAISFGKDGVLRAIQSHVVLEGGGQRNLTISVTGLATLHASGPYEFRHSSLHGVATIKPGPVVGSMRGFGIPQACFNIETAVDRIAVALGRDAIDLRLQNLLRAGDFDAAGTALNFHLANEQVCRIAAAQDLWTRREELKKQRRTASTLFGVGFACCMEAYGTSRDGVFAAVRLTPSGEIEVWSETIDMGQGARTAFQSSTERVFGKPADVVHMGEVELFEKLGVISKKGTPDSNPRYSPSGGSTSSASKTAFFHLHAMEEAARVVWRLSLAPAARKLWGHSDLSDDDILSGWTDGLLQREGCEPLTLAQLAHSAHESGSALGAIVHAYFYAGWSSASWDIGGTQHRWFIDGLALHTGTWTVLDRVRGSVERFESGQMPRTLYASGGHIISVEVHAKTGRVRVVDAISVVDAGDPVHPQLLAGQIEGGLAMGISHALFESLPASIGRARWTNLDTYRIARAADVPNKAHHKQILVPLDQDSILGQGQPRMRRKGIAEVTMTTVGAAIANAVAHAFDHEFWPASQPILPEHVRTREGARR